MFTFRDLLITLQDLRILDAALGFLLASYAQRWVWFQSKSSEMKRVWVAIFSFTIALVATVIYWFIFKTPYPIWDLVANVLYSTVMTFFGSQVKHIQYMRQADDGKSRIAPGRNRTAT